MTTANAGWRSAFSRVRASCVALLRAGMTPRRLALCLALGAGISVFPILGVATPLLAMLALALRLNLPLIQLVNYAGTPFQWLLIVPFLRLGEWVCGAEPLPLSPPEIVALLRTDAAGFFREFTMAAVYAVVGWAVSAAPLALLAYRVLGRTLAHHAARAAPDHQLREA